MDEYPIYEPMIIEDTIKTNQYIKIIYYTQFVLTFISFCMMIVMTSYISTTLKDSKKLLRDGSDTLLDFGELIPKVNESLYILETLCNSKQSPIHEWCKLN